MFVEFVVDERGDVACAAVKAGLPSGLSENAIAAVARSKFEPALYRGEPVQVKMSLPVTFRLR